MPSAIPTPPARGAGINPPNRFELLQLDLEPDALLDDDGNALPLRTQFYRDDTQEIIAWNNSPDVGFSAGCSPYRGCEHGCAYCFARPYHEYLGWSSGLDFESRILVKERAPELLRVALSRKSWKPQVVAMSAATDAYQPIERKLRLTRKCLEVFAEFRNPVVTITKNYLVTRDIDILAELAKWNAVGVCISLTTLDPEIAKTLEPRASSPSRRLAAIRELTSAGVPVRVLTAPIIPGLTDHEIPALLAAAKDAGAIAAGYTVVRLPHSVKPIFENWLERHRPGEKEKILGRIREMRDGKLYRAEFGTRMTGTGPAAERLDQLFEVSARRVGLPSRRDDAETGVRMERDELSTAHFRVPSAQMDLF